MPDPSTRRVTGEGMGTRVAVLVASEASGVSLPETKRVGTNLPRASAIFLAPHAHGDDDVYDDSSLSSHSVPDLKKSYAFVDSMSSEESGDEEKREENHVMEVDHPPEDVVPLRTIHTVPQPFHMRPMAITTDTSSFPKYSLLLGFLVGCFIQSSSLGANYVLTVLFGHDFEQIREHHDKIVVFSLLWSLATSTMGVLVILFLRSLLQAVPNASLHTNLHMWHVEYSFAFGALVGVCVAWTGTDVLLGFKAHAFHSLVTLAVAIALKVFMACTSRGNERSADFPLDEDDELMDSQYYALTEKSIESINWDKLHSHFKTNGIVLGGLIGFFIQMSSLGASFLLDTFAGGNQETPRIQLSTDGLLAFSLGWSFVFGTMGVMILVTLRLLLKMASGGVSRKSANKLGLMLEFYFAVGCLVGVNIAWVLTDVGLGLKAHVVRSLITLAAAAVWCRVLAFCFFADGTFEEADDDEDEDDDENDEDEILLVKSLKTRSRRQPDVYEGVLMV